MNIKIKMGCFGFTVRVHDGESYGGSVHAHAGVYSTPPPPHGPPPHYGPPPHHPPHYPPHHPPHHPPPGHYY